MTNVKRPLRTDLWDLSSDMVTMQGVLREPPMVYREFAFTHDVSCSREGIGQYP